MKQAWMLLVLISGSGLLSGCHCLPITERCADRIDHIADKEACMDCHYRPNLDVTRWGMWNGPRCCRNCN
ncbi:MAG: hypothetical protein WAO83_10670 [Fuerstiella sp.]